MTLALLLATVGCSSQNKPSGHDGTGVTSSPSIVKAAAPSDPTKTVCRILESPLTGPAVDELLKVVTGGRYEGGLASSLVVGIVQRDCSQLLGPAIKAVQNFFTPAPSAIRVADVSAFKAYAGPTLASTLLAVEFGGNGFPLVTAGQIDELVRHLCDDVLGSRHSTPPEDVKAVLPGADLRQMARVNSLYSLVLERCSLNNYQADGLLWNLTDYLISNIKLDVDVQPPILFGPTWAHAGPTSMTLSWSGFDASGVRSYDVWVRTNGTWTPILQDTTRTTSTITPVSAGNDYLFGLRAVDTRDNRSGWVYMTPCLTCP